MPILWTQVKKAKEVTIEKIWFDGNERMVVDGMKMKKRRKKRYVALYTEGELNRIVDAFIHPFANEESSFLVLDGVIHALLERDIQVSARKFIKYDLPEILKRIGKKGMTKRKRSKK